MMACKASPVAPSRSCLRHGRQPGGMLGLQATSSPTAACQRAAPVGQCVLQLVGSVAPSRIGPPAGPPCRAR